MKKCIFRVLLVFLSVFSVVAILSESAKATMLYVSRASPASTTQNGS